VKETKRWIEFSGEKDYKTIKGFVEELLQKMRNIKHYPEKEAIAKGANILITYKPSDEKTKNLFVDKWIDSIKNDILSLFQDNSKSEVLVIKNQKVEKRYSLSEKSFENIYGGKEAEEL
jgi:hypothetical protein